MCFMRCALVAFKAKEYLIASLSILLHAVFQAECVIFDQTLELWRILLE